MNRLLSVLEYATAHVPYYQQISGSRPPELSDFPSLRKREYVASFDRLLSDEYKSYVHSEDPQSWHNPTTLACEFTSGSSGFPLRCLKTGAERIRLGMSLFSKRKAIYPQFSPEQLFGFIHNPEFERDLPETQSLANLTEQNIERVLVYLRDVARPAVLHGNTMLLLYYAEFIDQHRFPLNDWKCQFIESVSESISAEQRMYIGRHFRTDVFDCYGCLECYNLAYECRKGSMHVNENVLIEILDRECDQAAAGEGEVAITSLVNRAQPFIRYRTGDLGSLQASDCPCGSSRPILKLSGQRTIDYMALLYKTSDPNLRICGYDIFAPVMHRMAQEGMQSVSWYNIIQSDLTKFEVQFIKRPDFDDSFYRLFRQYACERLGHEAQFQFEEKSEQEVLQVNRKHRVFRSLLQSG